MSVKKCEKCGISFPLEEMNHVTVNGTLYLYCPYCGDGIQDAYVQDYEIFDKESKLDRIISLLIDIRTELKIGNEYERKRIRK